MTFSDWPWRHWRRLREEAQALRLNERRLSWRELCAQIDALAVGFHAQGVRDGDGVLLRAYNQPDALLAWLALLQCGARPAAESAAACSSVSGTAAVSGPAPRAGAKRRRPSGGA